MLFPHGQGDLYHRYRPLLFSDVIGQDEITASLCSIAINSDRPKCFLFHGESGIGKTTVARIFAMALNCLNLADNGDPCTKCIQCTNTIRGSHPDILEINAVSRGKVDDIRDLEKFLGNYPFMGKSKVLILDECHEITSKGQQALLKPLEDGSASSSYIILCSTNPKKIISTVKNRGPQYKFNLLSNKDIQFLLNTVSTMELGCELPKAIIDALIDASEGRARNSLVYLQTVKDIGLDNEDKIFRAILNESPETEDLRNLGQALFRKNGWKDITILYKALKLDAIGIQLYLAGWCRNNLLRSTNYSLTEKWAHSLSVLINDLPLAKPENGLVSQLFKVHRIWNA